jgi:transcription elongation factor GreA
MSTVTLQEAAARYVASLDAKARVIAQPDVYRFVRWYGAHRLIEEMRGHNVSLYAEELGPATEEAKRRAEYVRGFLSYLKKEGMIGDSLASHLRLKKNTNKASISRAPTRQSVELTAEGKAALEAEMEALKAQRPLVREQIRHAMLDKDFRENAPLDAAKDKQAHLEARIREIDETLKHGVIVEKTEAAATRVHIGSTACVTNLGSGASLRYTIVGASEGNAAEGKITSVSPIGGALLGHSEGDEVSVSVPAGTLRLRIDKIEG